MKYYKEESLRDFEFWAGAKDRAASLTDEELDTIEQILEDAGEDWSEVEINDFFWFEFDTIARWLGFESEEEFFKQRN